MQKIRKIKERKGGRGDRGKSEEQKKTSIIGLIKRILKRMQMSQPNYWFH